MMKKNIFTFLLGLMFSFSAVAKEDAVTIHEYPRDMPEREIIGETGNKIKMKDFKGDFVLLIIWSKHCTPCVKELESLNTFVNKTKDSGIRLVMLSPEEEWEDAAEQRRFLEKYHATDLDFYTDKEGKLAEELGVFSSPYTILINTKAQEIGQIRGAAEWDSEKVIEYIYKLKAQHG